MDQIILHFEVPMRWDHLAVVLDQGGEVKEHGHAVSCTHGFGTRGEAPVEFSLPFFERPTKQPCRRRSPWWVDRLDWYHERQYDGWEEFSIGLALGLDLVEDLCDNIRTIFFTTHANRTTALVGKGDAG